MSKRVLPGLKPFNELNLKSCYYNQVVAGYSLFGIDPKIIAGNYLPLYKFDEKEKVLDVEHEEIFTQKELYDLTGVEKEFFKPVKNLKEFVITQIDNGCPVIIPVDCFYLTYREDLYKKAPEESSSDALWRAHPVFCPETEKSAQRPMRPSDAVKHGLL